MWTGPGRPSRASLNALGRIFSRSSTEWAWKLPLRNAPRDPREVGRVVAVLLLERAAVELRGRDLARDRDERGGVEEGVPHRDREQHRAGTGRGVDGDRDPGGAEVSVGHVAGGRLDPRPHQLDVVLAVVDAVQQPDGTVPGVAEDVGRLLLDQVVDDQVAAAHLAHALSSPVGAPGTLRRRRCLAVSEDRTPGPAAQ